MSRLYNILNTMVTKGVPKEHTFTGTTGSTGNLQLTSLSSSAQTVVPKSVSGSYMAVPFKSGSSWYLKVFAWNQTTYTVASSVNVTVSVMYWE